MIDLEDLHETWSIISKNKYMKTDAQVINFYRAVPPSAIKEKH